MRERSLRQHRQTSFSYFIPLITVCSHRSYCFFHWLLVSCKSIRFFPCKKASLILRFQVPSHISFVKNECFVGILPFVIVIAFADIPDGVPFIDFLQDMQIQYVRPYVAFGRTEPSLVGKPDRNINCF